MSRIFPIRPAPGPVSWTRQRAGYFVQSHCVLLSQAVRKRWGELSASNSRRGGGRVQKAFCGREWDWELLEQEQSPWTVEMKMGCGLLENK